jgi:hypothetical protein
MAYTSDDSPWAGAVTELLSQASAVLNKQSGQVMSAAPGKGPSVGALPVPYVSETLMGIAGRICPVTGAAVPASPPDKNRIRQQAHELIEALLGTLGQPAYEQAAPHAGPHYDQVPLLRCVAPVEPGGTASVTMKVANDENTPAEVSLYCTNFIADSGHEIPSLRVSVSPRRTTVPARGEVPFELTIAVPPQTPRGLYSGLIQATGCTYVKAVLSVQVL